MVETTNVLARLVPLRFEATVFAPSKKGEKKEDILSSIVYRGQANYFETVDIVNPMPQMKHLKTVVNDLRFQESNANVAVQYATSNSVWKSQDDPDLIKEYRWKANIQAWRAEPKPIARSTRLIVSGALAVGISLLVWILVMDSKKEIKETNDEATTKA